MGKSANGDRDPQHLECGFMSRATSCWEAEPRYGHGAHRVKRDVSVRLLVGADGAQSRVKKAAGLPSWGWDYGQRAVVATVKTEGMPAAALTGGATAWQVFLKNGPLALLPLWGNYA